jgi:hypothetical protein
VFKSKSGNDVDLARELRIESRFLDGDYNDVEFGAWQVLENLKRWLKPSTWNNHAWNGDSTMCLANGIRYVTYGTKGKIQSFAGYESTENSADELAEALDIKVDEETVSVGALAETLVLEAANDLGAAGKLDSGNGIQYDTIPAFNDYKGMSFEIYCGWCRQQFAADDSRYRPTERSWRNRRVFARRTFGDVMAAIDLAIEKVRPARVVRADDVMTDEERQEMHEATRDAQRDIWDEGLTKWLASADGRGWDWSPSQWIDEWLDRECRDCGDNQRKTMRQFAEEKLPSLAGKKSKPIHQDVPDGGRS